MFILKYKNIFLGVAALLIVASLAVIAMYGFKKSIDFTGGARVTFSYATSTAPNVELVKSSLFNSFGENKFTELGDNTYTVALPDLTEEDYIKVQTAISSGGVGAQIKEFSMIGPSISKEIVRKSVIGFILVVLAIGIFIWFSFRSVSYPVASWKYGIVTIIALLHDMIIPAGVMSWLGHTQGVEIDALFVVAILTILGISISDTIVIFDRIRENLKGSGKNANFEDIVAKSLNQSLVRSLATSVSVIAVLLALVFFGPDSTKYFSITLTIGMVVGTYSSIFVASPILVLISKHWRSR